MEKIISTPLGNIKGKEDDGVALFQGIPYAKPLTPATAFSRAEMVEPWEDTLDALLPSNNAPQTTRAAGLKYTDIDCLYLNIAAPSNASNVPIMVWIHGGSYCHGGAGKHNADPSVSEFRLSTLCKESGCLIISINYRLNLYGFLNLSFLAPDFPLNNGLEDQLLALKVIQILAPSFGGDIHNVTLFGQSSGAACILAHLARPASAPYFHKAIMMSPCVEHFFVEEESEKLGKRFLKYAHIKNKEQLLSISDKAYRKVADRFELSAFLRRELRCAYSPTLDDSFVSANPLEFLRDNKKPILIGQTHDEGRLYIYHAPTPLLSIVAKYMKIPRAEGKTWKEAYSDGLTKMVYTNPITALLEENHSPSYRYSFDFITPFGARTGQGAFHVCDVPILFGMDWFCNESKDPEIVEVAKKYRQSFIQFAKTGNPGFEEYRLSQHIEHIK